MSRYGEAEVKRLDGVEAADTDRDRELEASRKNWGWLGVDTDGRSASGL